MTSYKMVYVTGQPYLHRERACSMDPSDISKNTRGDHNRAP